jgi:Family of unknown function (DUF6152)
MRLQFIAILAGFAAIVATGNARAHHSFAMFDMEHPIELAGTVKEFKFVNPHTILILRVKGENGEVTDWTLEGGAPAMLVRAGMTSKSLKEGDEIIITINPLHSGAPGGSYQPDRAKFKDGTPVAVPRE